MTRMLRKQRLSDWRTDRLRSHSLLLIMQWLVSVFILAIIATYFAMIPDYHDTLVSKCVLQDCGINSPAPPTTEEALRADGLTIETYAMLFVTIDVAFSLLFAIAAVIIMLKGRHEQTALLAAIMLVSFGTTFPQLVHTSAADQPFWNYWFSAVSATGWITLFLFFFRFPDNRFAPKWTIVPVVLFSVIKLFSVLFQGTALDHDQWQAAPVVFLFVIPIGSLVYSSFYRYRTLTTEQRQMTKWIIYGASTALTGFITISLLFLPTYEQTPLTFVYLNASLHLFLLVIPITLSLAILKKKLWDVDPLVNRTLVYAALSVCIFALYSFTIFYIGRWFHSGSTFFPSFIAAFVVAITFAPLRTRLQLAVNRLMKGKHDDPYGTLAELRNLLVRPLPPDAMLDTVVGFIRKALRIPYVSIAIKVNGQEQFAASDGAPASAPLTTLPIVHLGKEVGALIAASRPGEPFTPPDRRLLEVFLGHAGPIVDNFIMTRGMKLLADDLQQSREKLVLAREEERRHLRRNLHDELAPRLAALGLNATAAEMYVKRDPEAAMELLADLRKVIRTTVEDIRTLVHDMRPAILEEWGLIGAIQERIRELSRPMQAVDQSEGAGVLQMEFEPPHQLPPLPAAVEVAAYWIVTEAIANVVRHAAATTCRVKLEVSPVEQLFIEVTDNGVGINERWVSSAKGGIGIGSIRERASELGGHCAIERLPTGGTRVRAAIPIFSERRNIP